MTGVKKSESIKKYAVLAFGAKQLLVREEEEFILDGHYSKIPEYNLLFVFDGIGVKVGQPHLNDVSLKIKLLSQEKGEKIDVRTYKAKSRYRRHIGFRPKITRFLLEKIS